MQKIFLCLCVIFMVAASFGGDSFNGNEICVPTPLEAKVPIIMYHLVTTNGRYLGRDGITPDALRQDIKYLHENGYTTIVVQDLINYVNDGVPLPQKPVMLTFDDGNYSDYKYLLPLLEEFDMRAVAAILGRPTDKYTLERERTPKADFPNMTWPEVLALHESGRVEIQNHSYDLHGSRGSGRKHGESMDAYRTRLSKDLTMLQARCLEKLGVEPTAFIYPLGFISEGSKEILMELGFKGSFSCESGMAVVRYGEPDSLFKMKRNNRANDKPVAEILRGLK